MLEEKYKLCGQLGSLDWDNKKHRFHVDSCARCQFELSPRYFGIGCTQPSYGRVLIENLDDLRAKLDREIEAFLKKPKDPLKVELKGRFSEQLGHLRHCHTCLAKLEGVWKCWNQRVLKRLDGVSVLDELKKELLVGRGESGSLATARERVETYWRLIEEPSTTGLLRLRQKNKLSEVSNWLRKRITKSKKVVTKNESSEKTMRIKLPGVFMGFLLVKQVELGLLELKLEGSLSPLKGLAVNTLRGELTLEPQASVLVADLPKVEGVPDIILLENSQLHTFNCSESKL